MHKVGCCIFGFPTSHHPLANRSSRPLPYSTLSPLTGLVQVMTGTLVTVATHAANRSDTRRYTRSIMIVKKQRLGPSLIEAHGKFQGDLHGQAASEYQSNFPSTTDSTYRVFQSRSSFKAGLNRTFSFTRTHRGPQGMHKRMCFLALSHH